MPDPQESFADLVFPNRGLDVSSGYAEQTPGTTPTGTNVRIFEPLTERGRGGSRPGMRKYGGAVVLGLTADDDVTLLTADDSLTVLYPDL